METTTSFDLNRAIQYWRENLTQSPAFRGENLEELESHLRDSINSLQTRGLSEEEAFSVGARRLGKVDLLSTEFRKVNAGIVWRDRARWMSAGVLFWTVAWDFSRAVASSLIYLGSLTGASGISLGWLNFVGKQLALGLIFIGFWCFITGRLQLPANRSKWMVQSSWSFFLVLGFIGIVMLKLVPAILRMLFIRNVTPEVWGQAYSVLSWFDFISPLVVALVFARLLFRKPPGKSADGIAAL